MPTKRSQGGDAERSWNASVYALARLIPRGRVTTYGLIATAIGRPRGAREVGWAMHACEDDVPCHRVVTREGRLAPHFHEQRRLLAREGVRFSGAAVELARHLWIPPIAPRHRTGTGPHPKRNRS